ncbi:MAG: hypothetical protein CUN53_16500, partial [Phototrophicales bacterium]
MNALIDLSDDMRALLDDPDGAFTLFAPLDGNWTVRTYWDTTFDLANVVSDPARADVLLRYYIVPMVIEESGFLYVQPVYLEYGTMLPGYTIYADMHDGAYIYNSVSSVIETIPASNGVVGKRCRSTDTISRTIARMTCCGLLGFHSIPNRSSRADQSCISHVCHARDVSARLSCSAWLSDLTG